MDHTGTEYSRKNSGFFFCCLFLPEVEKSWVGSVLCRLELTLMASIQNGEIAQRKYWKNVKPLFDFISFLKRVLEGFVFH